MPPKQLNVTIAAIKLLYYICVCLTALRWCSNVAWRACASCSIIESLPLCLSLSTIVYILCDGNIWFADDGKNYIRAEIFFPIFVERKYCHFPVMGNFFTASLDLIKKKLRYNGIIEILKKKNLLHAWNYIYTTSRVIFISLSCLIAQINCQAMCVYTVYRGVTLLCCVWRGGIWVKARRFKWGIEAIKRRNVFIIVRGPRARIREKKGGSRIKERE